MSSSALLVRRAERLARRDDEEEEEDAPTDTYFSIRNKFVNQEGFRKMCEKAFEEVDFNGNGRIDLTEFYAGVLLLYDKVNSVSGRFNAVRSPRMTFVVHLDPMGRKEEATEAEEY